MNHGSTVFKIYVMGTKHYTVKRGSLRFQAPTVENRFCPFCRVSIGNHRPLQGGGEDAALEQGGAVHTSEANCQSHGTCSFSAAHGDTS